MAGSDTTDISNPEPNTFYNDAQSNSPSEDISLDRFPIPKASQNSSTGLVRIRSRDSGLTFSNIQTANPPVSNPTPALHDASSDETPLHLAPTHSRDSDLAFSNIRPETQAPVTPTSPNETAQEDLYSGIKQALAPSPSSSQESVVPVRQLSNFAENRSSTPLPLYTRTATPSPRYTLFPATSPSLNKPLPPLPMEGGDVTLYSTYTSVHVLLMAWQSEDSALWHELHELAQVFSSLCHYNVEILSIPSPLAFATVEEKLKECCAAHFRDPNHLLIVFYIGDAEIQDLQLQLRPYRYLPLPILNF